MGGESGGALALNTREVIIPIFIKTTTLAVLFGLINYYTTGDYALTIDDNEEN